MKSFDIGQRVTWKISNFTLVGVFIEDLLNGSSLVKCHSKDGIRCICEVEVLSSLIQNYEGSIFY